jgi:hypothetical protein
VWPRISLRSSGLRPLRPLQAPSSQIKALRQNAELLRRIRVILAVQSLQAKIFQFRINPNHFNLPPFRLDRGAFRDRHGREAGCGGRLRADGRAARVRLR